MFRLDRILFGVGIASSRFLSRQVLRWSLLGLAVHAVSSRVHRAGSRQLLLSRAGSSGGRAVRRERVHRRRERDRRFQVLGVSQDHVVVRSSLVGVSDASRTRNTSGLPAGPGVRRAQVLRSHLHLVHQVPRATSRSTKFGFNTAPMADMIHWANIVDGAQYESPEAAVEMAAPAMKLTLIIESTQDPAFIPRLIPLLTEMPLAEVLAQPFVRQFAAAAAGATPSRRIELIRSRSEERDGTIFFDITDQPMEGLQQVHPLLSASAGDVLDWAVEVELPHQGCGGLESVDQGRPREDGEPGRRSANATAAAVMRAWARSASRPTRRIGRGKRPRRLWRSCERRIRCKPWLETDD